MRKLLTTTLLCGSCVLLRADFMYQDTTQMTGGALVAMLKLGGPFTRQAREPIVSTHIIKGDRMATITKDHASIIDLGKETITEIDFAKKTYSVMTFAEMKQAVEDAMNRMQGQKADDKSAADSKIDAKFNVSAKATGQTKTVQGLVAKELLMTMALEAADKQSGQSGAMTITIDTWVAPIPGYEEVKEFHRKMGEKMGYLFGSGMSQMAMMRPETAKGFAEVGKEMAKLDGTPVQSILKMSGTATDGQSTGGSTAPAQPRAQPQQGPPTSTSAAIGRLAGGLGGFGRKKKDDPPPTADQQATSDSASLIEMTTELTSFSSRPVDASKFEVPAGFKQVDPPMRGRRGQ